MPTPQFHYGDVVLIPFPFADLSGRKVRPAIIISADPQASEIIFAFVTSVISNRSPRGAEVELLKLDREFGVSGLKVDSLIGSTNLSRFRRRWFRAGWEELA